MISNEEKRTVADHHFEDGKKLKDDGKYKEALKSFRKAYNIHKKVSIISSAYDLMEIAYCQKEIGNLEIAEKAFYDAEQTFLSVSCENEYLAECLFGRADILCYRGLYPEAEPFYNKALNILEEVLGPNHLDVAKLLNKIATLKKRTAQFTEAEPLYLKALNIYEKVLGPNHPDVAEILNNIAYLKRETGQYMEAESLCRRALSIREKALGPDHPDVAETLNSIALLKYFTGEYAAAEPLYQRVLSIRERVLGPDHEDVALTLNSIALLKSKTGQYSEAESFYRRALSIYEKALGPDHIDVAAILNGIASLKFKTGQYSEAEPLYQRALKIAEKSLGPDHPDVAAILGGIALLKYETGQYSEAEPLYQRALKITEKALGPDHPDVAIRLNSIAVLKSETGQYAEAEPLYQRALKITEKALGPDHPTVAMMLNNIAFHKRETGQYTEAEPLYQRALNIYEKALGSDHPTVATILSNIAELKCKNRQYSEAEPFYQRALSIREKALGPDHPDLATTLNDIAVIKRNTGKYAEAELLLKKAISIFERAFHDNHPSLAYPLCSLATVLNENTPERKEEIFSLYQKALRISQCSKVPEILSTVQYQLAKFFSKEKQNGTAIFFGKLAVNSLQNLRSNISQMGQNVLQAHQFTIEEVFNHLSGLLVEDGRFAEAEQVINLLKQHQYFEYIRRDAVHPDEFLVKVTYTLTEAACDRLYLDNADKITELISERNEVLEKQQGASEKQFLLSELDKRIKKATNDFNAAIDRICNELNLTGQESRMNMQIEDTSDLMETLGKLGSGSVAIYTVITKDIFHLLLITPKYRKHFSKTIREEELHKKIYTFRQSLLLQEGNLYDPIDLAKELYQIILGPVAGELRKIKAKTIMWSLEGPMRYIPMAALHDGEQYLVESYRNVMFTPANTSHIQDNPERIWKGFGLGVTEHHDPFPSLPMVREELDSIIRSRNAPGAVFNGTKLLDKSFTWQSMQKGLKKKFPLVHIASHFQCAPGNDTTSFILLGDGERLSIDKIRSQSNLFGGVDLLTLSACNTAVGNVGQDGKEIECFGVFAQRQGAKAIVASLWPVADISTSLLMKEFYMGIAKGKSKAEALQDAQIALLTGRINSDHISTSVGRSTTPVEEKENLAEEGEPSLFRFKTDPKMPLAHPFFWAPFILIGNWK
jgi:CHAT domain-containing protein/Tfp pilus assembly protein PilF